MSDDTNLVQTTVPYELAGERADKVLARLYPDYSRAKLTQWLKDNLVTFDEQVLEAADKVKGGEIVVLTLPKKPATHVEAQNIDISIIFEDDDIIVINKAKDMVVHPGNGHPDNTLVNALLHHDNRLEALPRAGIVHRLDKDTTGLLLIAKNLKSHKTLIEAMQNREIDRHYLALVKGQVTSSGLIDTYFGRHPKVRTKMAVVKRGKKAITHYTVKERFLHFSLLDIKLETGRTHQIRVHMAHLKHPIIGDMTYARPYIYKNCPAPIEQALKDFKRQALHAYELTFPHPSTTEKMTLNAPLPYDLENLLALIKQHDK